ncbi:hypothetical protein HKX48_002228 [Thoreauomyces humboldtii]|nr:hypothetical protein HKX48_002228 [Thoreauomyces humboldtii]
MLFHIGYNIFGVETLWEAIAQEFQTKIYLSPLRFAVYSALQPCPPYITNDPTSTRFHACQKCDICPPARSSGEIVHIRLSTMGWRDELRTAGTGIDARQFPLKQLGERYWHVLYSIHSSFEELSDLVTVLRPREVFPCVLSADRLDSKRVKDLFTQFLRPPSPEHTRATAILDVEELLESSQGTDVVDEEGIYAVKAEDVKGEDMKSADIKDEDGKARDPSGELEPRYMRRERSIDSVENELQAASAVSSLSLQDAPVPCPHPIETTHSNDHHDANLTSIPDHPHFSDDDFIEIESDTTSESIDFGVVHDHSDSDPDPGIMSQHRQSDIPKTSQRVNRSFDQHPSPASTVRSVRTLSPVAVVDDVIPVSIRSPLQRRATWVPDAVQTFEKPRLVKSTTNVRLADRAPRRLPSHWTLPEVIDLTED